MEQRVLKTRAQDRSGLYRCEPLNTLDLPGGPVPVFSRTDAYTENYEQIARDHVSHMAATGANPFIPERVWRESEALTAALLRKYGRPGQRVLDVGCGLGRLLESFADYQRYGMDISPAYLEHAQRKGLDVCLARVEEMPYVEGAFDLVVCTDVLEHVLDLDMACRKILGVVRAGGYLLVRVPYREDLSAYRSMKYEFVHLRNFDEDALALLFEKIHGGRVVEVAKGPYDVRYSPWKGRRFGGLALSAPLRVTGWLTGAFGRGAQQAYLRWAFDPLEINIVVQLHRES